MQGEIEKSTIIAGDFNTPFSVMNRSRRQNISKDIVDLNDTITQLGLTDIYRIFHSTEHSSQARMENSLRQTTFWAMKHT